MFNRINIAKPSLGSMSKGTILKTAIALSFIILCVATLFYPLAPLERVISLGTDTYETHHAIFGKRVMHQSVAPYGSVNGLGLIPAKLVSRRPAPPLSIQIEDTRDNIIAQTQIKPENFIDDEFSWIEVPEISDPFVIIASAPTATSASPIGLRFEKENPMQLALAVKETVPLWRFVQTKFTISPNGPFALAALAIATPIAILLLLPSVFAKFIPGRINPIIPRVFFLILITCASLSIHTYLHNRLYGVSGGDAYNYLSITQTLSNFQNPFTADKRLPGWPLLQLPAYLTNIDDIWFMRFLSGLSYAGILIILPLLALRLRLPWIAGAVASLLLLYQRDFLLTSLRPEAYTFYALLTTLSLVLFTYIKKAPAQILLGGVLGYATTTRQEGFVLALVLGICSLAYWKNMWWKGYARLILPALILVLPFFIHNATAYGNPLYTPYFEGGRNELVNSWESFIEHASATWGILGTLWHPFWEGQIRFSLLDPYILIGAILVLAIWLLVPLAKRTIRNMQHQILIPVSLAILLSSIYYLVNQNAASYGEIFSKITAGALLASFIPYVHATRWRGLPLILVLVSQALIAIWFHPFPKHYQQSLPLLTLIFTTGLLAPLNFFSFTKVKDNSKEDTSRTSARFFELLPIAIFLIAIITPFLCSFMLRYPKTNAMLDEANRNTAIDNVIYDVVQKARQLPGPHGFDNYYQPASLYFEGTAFTYPGEPGDEGFQLWLENHNIRTFATTNTSRDLLVPPKDWQEVAEYLAEGKNEKRFIGRVYILKP